MSDAEFSRGMDEYWNSLEGVGHGRRVNFYTKEELWPNATRCDARRVKAGGFVA